MHERTVHRWLSGERRIPLRVWSRLRDLPRDRISAIRHQMAKQQMDGARRIRLCASAGTEANAIYIRAQHEERCRRNLRAAHCRALNERRRMEARRAPP